ncbi:MAG: DUF3795 domain-containing protein [Chitinophagales bacterium]
MGNPISLDKSLIAPCGMNCGLCLAYLRPKNKCTGCNGPDLSKPAYCIKCIMRNCETIQKNESKLCYECDTFPCKRLKQLDKRYRTKYSMSMIENLNNIKEFGMDEFIKNQTEKWKCPTCGGAICVHRGCLDCK